MLAACSIIVLPLWFIGFLFTPWDQVLHRLGLTESYNNPLFKMRPRLKMHPRLKISAFERIVDLEPKRPWDKLLSLAIGIIFCGIHFFAWDYSFPTLREQLIWRYYSLVDVGALIMFSVILVASHVWKRSPQWVEFAKKLAAHVIVCDYALGRFVLIGLAFSAMRDLPDGSYKAVDWTNAIPHIH